MNHTGRNMVPVASGKMVSKEAIMPEEQGSEHKSFTIKHPSGSRIDVIADDRVAGVWVEGSRGEVIGIVAERGKSPFVCLYPKGGRGIPLAISVNGIQLPSPSDKPPRRISWDDLYDCVRRFRNDNEPK